MQEYKKSQEFINKIKENRRSKRINSCTNHRSEYGQGKEAQDKIK